MWEVYLLSPLSDIRKGVHLDLVVCTHFTEQSHLKSVSTGRGGLTTPDRTSCSNSKVRETWVGKLFTFLTANYIFCPRDPDDLVDTELRPVEVNTFTCSSDPSIK